MRPLAPPSAQTRVINLDWALPTARPRYGLRSRILGERNPGWYEIGGLSPPLWRGYMDKVRADLK